MKVRLLTTIAVVAVLSCLVLTLYVSTSSLKHADPRARPGFWRLERYYPLSKNSQKRANYKEKANEFEYYEDEGDEERGRSAGRMHNKWEAIYAVERTSKAKETQDLRARTQERDEGENDMKELVPKEHQVVATQNELSTNENRRKATHKLEAKKFRDNEKRKKNNKKCELPTHTYVIGIKAQGDEIVKSRMREVCALLHTQCHFIEGATLPQNESHFETWHSWKQALSVPRSKNWKQPDASEEDRTHAMERALAHLDVWRRVSDYGQSESPEWVVILEARVLFNPAIGNYFSAADIFHSVEEFFCRAKSHGLVYLGAPSSNSSSSVCTPLPSFSGLKGELSLMLCSQVLNAYAYAVRRIVAADMYLHLYTNHSVICSQYRCAVDSALLWYTHHVLRLPKGGALTLRSMNRFLEADGLFLPREVNPEVPEAVALADVRVSRITLAVIANEFFSQDLGRMGGFGFAASRLALLFTQKPWLGVDVVFLSALPRGGPTKQIHGVSFIPAPASKAEHTLYREQITALKISLAILIDCRIQYASVLRFLPSSVPTIVWIRDPKTPEDHSNIAGVRIPGVAKRPQESSPAITGLEKVLLQRPASSVVLVPVSPSLVNKIEGAYPEYTKALAAGQFEKPSIYSFLPNLIDIGLPFLRTSLSDKAETPTVLFLGRLDPVKRVWLYVELARKFPHVQFFLCGSAYTKNGLGFSLSRLPQNVKYVKFASGETKFDLLRKSWLVISTSIHEGLALNFLEAFWFSTPVVATTDVEGVVSRFGAYVASGNGNSLLFNLEVAVRDLLENVPKRESLGRAAWEWVRATHTSYRFVEEFRPILRDLGFAVLDPAGSSVTGAGSSDSDSGSDEKSNPTKDLSLHEEGAGLTVVALCYSQKRFENLQKLMALVASLPIVNRVIVVCNNFNLCPTFPSSIEVVHPKRNTLSNRWDVGLLNLSTRHVAVLDDDLRPYGVICSALTRGYQLAVRFPSQLISLGGLENPCRKLVKYAHSSCDEADFVIPPYIVPVEFLESYTEVATASVVGEQAKCDDIAMFLLATTKAPALLLQPSSVNKVRKLGSDGLFATISDDRVQCAFQLRESLGSRGLLPRAIVQMVHIDLPETL